MVICCDQGSSPTGMLGIPLLAPAGAAASIAGEVVDVRALAHPASTTSANGAAARNNDGRELDMTQTRGRKWSTEDTPPR